MSFSHYAVEESEETKKQLEKERDFRCEEAFKKFNQVKMEVESQRRDLEARQKNVEAVVSKVLLHDLNFRPSMMFQVVDMW